MIDVWCGGTSSNEEEDRNQDSLVAVDSSTVVPSVSQTSPATNTGKQISVKSNNFTCSALRDNSPEVGSASPCPVVNEAVVTTPMVSVIEKNTGDDDPRTPHSVMADDNGGGDDIPPLSNPGTVVPSMEVASTSCTPGVAKHAAIPAHLGKARGVSFLTSTPVRTEAGHTQTQGDTKTKVKSKCEHTEEGMCLLHQKQAKEWFTASWVTQPGPGGKLMKKYQKKYYWQCDIAPRSRKTLSQTRLSFARRPSVVQQGGRDTRGGDDKDSILTTPTGGKGGAELSVDKE